LEDRSLLSGYQQHNLVGFQPGMAHYTDPNLNGWGLAFAPDGPFWVADTATGVSTVYDHQGKPLPLVVTIPGGLTTGIVYNPTSDFVISKNGKSGPALFIFDSISGIISGWNPSVDSTHAVLMKDNSATGANYFDLALAQNSKHQNVLYAANGGNGRFEMYDGSLNLLGTFTDPAATASQSPVVYGIKEINGRLYGEFASFTANPWGGWVDVFDTDGNLLKKFTSNDRGKGPLANPWGIVQAPSNFGSFSNDILIGNVEQDAGPQGASINAFDPNTGAFLGYLKQPDGTPIAIPGLWDMDYGAGSPQNGKTNELFFTAGVNAISFAGNGLFGYIHAAGDQGPRKAALGGSGGGPGQPDGSTAASTQTAILSNLTGATASSVVTVTGSQSKGSDPVSGQPILLGSILLDSSPFSKTRSPSSIQLAARQPAWDVLDRVFADLNGNTRTAPGKLPSSAG
jgi:uncharacterized protein (TIGR03118 family)